MTDLSSSVYQELPFELVKDKCQQQTGEDKRIKTEKQILHSEMLGFCTSSSLRDRLSSLKPRSLISASPTDDTRLLHET